MYEGILNVYKERGFTSHDVVAKLRGILQMKKIGHTGTLDPDAEGVLPVCLGKATRLCDLLTDEGKTYRTEMLLGVETDTQDIGGRVLRQAAVTADEAQVRAAVLGFTGEYDQIPPMYSALKVDGKKLYELARQGKVVERAPRRVIIHGIEIESVELPRVTMTVHCSKGTYIRTLCHDIGQKLGCGACMESLLRVRVGRFPVEESLRLSQIEALRDSGGLAARIVPIEAMFSGYPKAYVLQEADRPAHNGNPLGTGQVRLANGAFSDMRTEDAAESGMAISGGRAIPAEESGISEDGREYCVYDSAGIFLGIYVYERSKDRFRPRKLFLPEDRG